MNSRSILRQQVAAGVEGARRGVEPRPQRGRRVQAHQHDEDGHGLPDREQRRGALDHVEREAVQTQHRENRGALEDVHLRQARGQPWSFTG